MASIRSRPLTGISMGGGIGNVAQQQVSKLPFKTIKGIDGLEVELKAAKAAGKPVMLDFYADWCVSCKEMEAFTFSDPAVHAALKDVILLKADVTPNDEKDQALNKHFGIFGPPAIMFFDKDGNERREYRVVGFVPADKFSAHVRQAVN